MPVAIVPAAPVLQTAQQLERTFTLSPAPLFAAPFGAHPMLPLGGILLILWASGFAYVLIRWAAAWLFMHNIVRYSRRVSMNFPVPVCVSSAAIEPGVFGIVRPVLLLPEELTRSFQTVEMDAILAHELCHVRRRDNLTAALHTIVQALFWFHPAVWLIGSKLLEERELACDQEVLRVGNAPESYAEGILRVCRLCLEPAGICAAGVSGSHLRERIEAILAGSVAERLSRSRRVVIAAAVALAIAGPIVFGILQTQRAQAQVAGKLEYEVATVKPSYPNAQGQHFLFQRDGKFSVANETLKDMIANAYQVRDFQVTGGPAWISSDRFDIEAKTGEQDTGVDPRKLPADQRATFEKQRWQRVQSLLADRFHLAIREEQRQMTVYALVVAKGGPKLKRVDAARGGNTGTRGGRGELEGMAASPEWLASALSSIVRRPVLDKTGLDGVYDWKLTWTPEQSASNANALGDETPAPSDISGPSIVTAIQDQLGLRLESQKAPARMIVVESAVKPAAN